MLKIKNENQSFNFGRAITAGVIFALTMLVFNLFLESIVWWIIITPLMYLPIFIATPISYIVSVIVFGLIASPAILFYFADRNVDVIESVSLGAVAIVCVYFVTEIENSLRSLTLPSGHSYTGNLSLSEVLMFIVGFVLVAQVLDYLQGSRAAHYER